MSARNFCIYEIDSARQPCFSLFGCRRLIAAWLLLLAACSFGCKGSPASSNGNSTAVKSKQATSGNANAEAQAGTDQATSVDLKEPERYGVAVTISAQDIAEGQPEQMATQQFGFAKIGADRRWEFKLPAPLGQVVYLEKSGLRYLVFFDHKQYIELLPDTLPFSISGLSPSAIAEHLKPRMRFDKPDPEPMNGRVVIRYSVAGDKSDAGDKADGDGSIFVDAETGLPLRSDFRTSPQGAKTRVIVEARELQLNPDRSQFDVPSGMKKITTKEATPQIEEFATRLRAFVEIVAGTRAASAAVTNQPAPSPRRGARRRR